MRWPAKIIASGFGTGFFPFAPGTLAAAAACLVWMLFAEQVSPSAQFLVAVGLSLAGGWASDSVRPAWGEDPSRVTIDEWAGMWISLIWIPVGWITVLCAFLLFRFFDIAKPLFIRRMERIRGGWGIMADDILAGVYTNCAMQAGLYLSR